MTEARYHHKKTVSSVSTAWKLSWKKVEDDICDVNSLG